MIRHPLRVYVDSWVYGGAFDEEFDDRSRAFFDDVRRGWFLIVTSPVVQREIADAPASVRELFAELAAVGEVQVVTDEAEVLAQAYLDVGILTEKSRADALHVALATVAGCDVIVSWNFKHLVNFYRAPLYSAVNVLKGHRPIVIQSPPEMTADEDEDV